MSAIKALTRSNYKKLRRDIELTLDLMNLDMCLLEAKPITIDVDVSIKARLEKWEKSRLSLMVIRQTILENIYGGIPSPDNVKDFLKAIGQKFKESVN